jgi:catechol 2,3-dioxygenase-like lactoylglutathione lyase family enzyme
MFAIDRIDHVVLTASNVDATCEFYRRVLNMDVQTFEGGRRALAFGHQKINLHQAGHEFEPKAAAPAPGCLDVCFITTTPIAEVIAHLVREGVAILEGPVERTGAQGPLLSVYFFDPDGNLIEVANSLVAP